MGDIECLILKVALRAACQKGAKLKFFVEEVNTAPPVYRVEFKYQSIKRI